MMVWEKSLLRAYELESNIAIYPRVIIDASIIAEVKKTLKRKNIYYTILIIYAFWIICIFGINAMI